MKKQPGSVVKKLVTLFLLGALLLALPPIRQYMFSLAHRLVASQGPTSSNTETLVENFDPVEFLDGNLPPQTIEPDEAQWLVELSK